MSPASEDRRAEALARARDAGVSEEDLAALDGHRTIDVTWDEIQARKRRRAGDMSVCANCFSDVDVNPTTRLCPECSTNPFARRVAAAELLRYELGDDAIEELLDRQLQQDAAQAVADMRVVDLDAFVGVDEPGVESLLGEGEDSALIPEGGDVMIYGDGGAGKTTLAIDLAFHLAAGDEWLGIAVKRPVNVLLIENEGPRPMFRRKLRRKLGAWSGGPINGRILVFERPWREFALAGEEWREELARVVAEREIDLVIAGPLTRIGMDGPGSLHEVATFMGLVADVRRLLDRPVTVSLIHHENKAGAVSGAWEGSGDTLLHVQAAGNGHTVVFIQKARWDRERHQTTMKLAWADGDGYELEADRDLPAEVKMFLAEHPLRTVREIAASQDADPPGVGANRDAIKAIVEGSPEEFDYVTGDDATAAGRRSTAILWRWLSAPEPPEPAGQDLGLLGVGDGGGGSVAPP